MADNHGLTASSFRAGYVALAGQPNVGKSTLFNALVGQQLSIVTKKPQTTRHRVIGISSSDEAQMIFLDTPGILEPRYRLHDAMMKSARLAMSDADIILWMIDMTSVHPGEEFHERIALETLKELKKPVYLVINKIDLVEKDRILPVIASSSAAFPFHEIFPLSALKGDGVPELRETLIRNLPLHPPYYPPEMITEAPERFFVSELIRARIFENLRDELPYSTSVDILDFREEPGKKDLIQAEIYVERDSQKGIVIGKEGKSLKKIGQEARRDIEAFLERPVFLELHVKVRNKWRESDAWLKRLGYL